MEWMTNITEAIVTRARTIQHDPSSILTNTNNTTNGTVWSLVISPSVYGTVFTLGCLLFFALAVHKEWVRSFHLQFEPSSYLSRDAGLFTGSIEYRTNIEVLSLCFHRTHTRTEFQCYKNNRVPRSASYI